MDNQKVKIIKGLLIGVGGFLLFRSISNKTSSANDRNQPYTIFNPNTDGPGVWFGNDNSPKTPKYTL